MICKKALNKILVIITMAAVLFGFAAVSFGATGGLKSRKAVNYMAETEWPQGPEIDAQGAYLIELNSGAVLYKKNADENYFPASITKILTALVVIENCELDEMVKFSHNAVYDIEVGGFSYIAEEGDELSVKDCLYAMMLNSSNEAAYALAEHCSGSLPEFAKLMNAKAKEVGATNSYFVTPNGLTNPDHVTTAHDMAMIMWAAIQNPVFLEIDSTVSYWGGPTTTNKDGTYCEMRHSMMRNTEFHDDRVIAGKTGYTSTSLNTLVTYASEGDKELIAVVLRVNGTGQACKDTKKLLDYGFNNFELRQIASPVKSEELSKLITEKYGRNVSNINYDSTINMLMPKTVQNVNLFYEPDLDNASLTGDELSGKVKLTLGNSTVGYQDFSAAFEVIPETVPATEEPANDIPENEKSNITSVIKIVLIVIAALFLIVIILMILKSVRNKIRRRKRLERIRKRRERRERM